MALPRRRQRRFTGHMELNGFNRRTMAAALGIDRIRLHNLICGATYPTPDELDKIERLFGGMPAEVLFDPEMLAYRGDWPPPRGMADQATVRKMIANREAKKSGGSGE